MTTSDSELTITVRADKNAEPRTWTLRCDPPGGDHPEPAAACRALERVRDPFAPVPPDARCTLIYGGPQTATITGSWQGRHVEAGYDRTDGCEINRWNAIAPVLEPGA
ncbi:MAG: SSI family serine proteinase inhibitor [Streptomycetales bacterium]